MKKIINGKKYDTETATIIGCWNNGRYGNDFSACSERLYKTKGGKFFLHGEGGPMSAYSKPVGNMTCGGEAIIALTMEQAKEWAEEHLTADEYEAAFGAVPEAGEAEAPNQIVVIIEGGVCQEVFSTFANVNVEVIDHDVKDGGNEDEVQDYKERFKVFEQLRDAGILKSATWKDAEGIGDRP